MFKSSLWICLFTATLAAPNSKQGYYPGGRIIGGVDAKIEDFPYMVSVTFNGQHLCGAGLISDTWALTAAHCFYGVSKLTIRGNSSLLDDGPSVAVRKFIAHPEFNYATKVNDIGLIELAEPLKCTYCKPIALSKIAPVAGKNATLVGWGVWNQQNYSLSPILQTAQVPVVDRNECNKNYEAINLPVSENMFCVGLLDEGGLGPCNGDSGSPVIQGGQVVGVVSWGKNCAQPKYPGVNTLVSSYLDWIEKTSGVAA